MKIKAINDEGKAFYQKYITVAERDQFCSDIRIFLNMIDDSFADIRGK